MIGRHPDKRLDIRHKLIKCGDVAVVKVFLQKPFSPNNAPHCFVHDIKYSVALSAVKDVSRKTMKAADIMLSEAELFTSTVAYLSHMTFSLLG